MAQTARKMKQQPKAPALQVRVGGAAAIRQKLHGLLVGGLGLLAFAALIALLISQSYLSEITMKIQDRKEDLKAANNTYSYLSGELNDKTNMKNVDEVATGQLGLVKVDSDQITYFSLNPEGGIVKPGRSDSLWSKLAAVQDYITGIL